MSVDNTKFIQDSLDANGGELSPQDAARLLDQAMGFGDTDTQSDSNETPDVTAEETTDPEAEVDQGPADEVDADTPDETPSPESVDDADKVILARDGKHTIPYDVLVREREEKQAALDELAAMKAVVQEQTPSNTEKTQHEKQIDIAQEAIENGADASLFGDFTEEDLAQGINKLVAQQVEARVKAALEPMQKQQEVSVAEAHMKAIYDAHNDADSIVESREFGEWAAAQPSYAQAAISNVLQQGTANQIIELFNNFKQSTASADDIAKPEPELSKEDLKAKAREAIKNTKTPVPTSLTDMPGHAGATAIEDQMPNMDPKEILATMQDWPPEKIEKYLNNLK